jgi:preprotein translocase subunit SecD
MTTSTTFDPAKALTDFDIVKAFASKATQTGEEPNVRFLWDNHYRINYFNHTEQRIGRSLFITLVGDKVEIAKSEAS